MRLSTLALAAPASRRPTRVSATVAGQPVAATLSVGEGKVAVRLAREVLVKAGETLVIVLG